MNMARHRTIRGRWSRRVAFLAVACAWLATVAAPTPAIAASFPFEAEFGSFGAGAGELHTVGGIASSPVDHRVYVADSENRRVNAFTAWGEFLFAFGRGVEDGSDEAQRCTS